MASKAHRTQYTIGFKRKLVEFYLDGYRATDIARVNDVPRSQLYLWINKYRAGEFGAVKAKHQAFA